MILLIQKNAFPSHDHGLRIRNMINKVLKSAVKPVGWIFLNRRFENIGEWPHWCVCFLRPGVRQRRRQRLPQREEERRRPERPRGRGNGLHFGLIFFCSRLFSFSVKMFLNISDLVWIRLNLEEELYFWHILWNIAALSCRTLSADLC